jgi:flagellar hook-basal body complex protein FliE
MSAIASISSILSSISAPKATAASEAAPFQSVLLDAMQKVEAFQSSADASVNRFLSGEGEELHQVALKTQQADLSFQLFMQARNKIVSAYQEVMRMQI